MSWSYDPATLSTNVKDQIRLRIGDTNESDQLLADEEIEFYLQQCNNDITRTSYQCINTVITRICSQPDYTLGPYSESNSNRLKTFNEIKEELSTQCVGFNPPVFKEPTTEPIFSYDLMSERCCDRKEPYDE